MKNWHVSLSANHFNAYLKRKQNLFYVTTVDQLHSHDYMYLLYSDMVNM